MTTTNSVLQEKKSAADWFIRLLKGILVGIGFIVPGLSGGVLAVVFGLYEPLMRFLGNLAENFKRNLLFFIPVGIGMALGVVAFSAVVDFAFTNYAAQFIWLLIGFISGTFPSLLKTAGKKGRKSYHWVILGLTAVGVALLLRWIETLGTTTLPQTFANWVLSGALIGLGVVVPGMSPSNFLIYMGLYQPMASGIRHLDLGVVIPLVLGLGISVLLLAKLVSFLFNKAYTFMYHFILGIVVGSTIAILPAGVSGWTIIVCALLFVVGVASSLALARLDEKYPHESII